MLELLESLELRSLIDLNKYNNQMLVLNVVSLISEKLVMNISHILFNAKLPLLVLLY